MKVVGLFYFLAAPLIALNQLNTTIHPDQVEIGEAFEIRLEVPINTSNSAVHWPADWFALRPNKERESADTIVLEVLNSVDTMFKKQSNSKGEWVARLTLKVLCFDTGLMLFQPNAIRVDSKERSLQTALFNVRLVDIDPQGDIQDIIENFAEIPAEPFRFGDFIRRYWWVLALVLAFVCLLLWKKSRKSFSPATESTFDPFLEAQKELDELYHSKLWEEDLPEYFTKNVSVLKRLIAHVLSQETANRTTLQLQLLLRKEGVSETLLEQATFLLNIGDLIKFAQSRTGERGVTEVHHRMQNWIQQWQKQTSDGLEHV